MMDEVTKAFLILIAATFIFFGLLLCMFSDQNNSHEKKNCQIEGMRSNRTVLEIKEICQ